MVSRPGGGGSPDRWPGGQEFMCCVRNPRNINVFVRVPGREESGSRPGGSVTGVTEKLFMCQMFMCLFWPLKGGGVLCISCSRLVSAPFFHRFCVSVSSFFSYKNSTLPSCPGLCSSLSLSLSLSFLSLTCFFAILLSLFHYLFRVLFTS